MSASRPAVVEKAAGCCSHGRQILKQLPTRPIWLCKVPEEEEYIEAIAAADAAAFEPSQW